MGEATHPSFTLDTYSHLFAKHENELRDKLEESFGHRLDGNTMSTGGGNQPQLAPVKTAQISVLGG